MNSYIEVMAIVEGKTEEIFINSLLQPYLARKMIFISATQANKPGQKGGDVHFDRIKRDLAIHLKQRRHTYVTTFIDYYGTSSSWPGFSNVPPGATPGQIASIVNEATRAEILSLFPDLDAARRFIPFMAIHEFEALLFSDARSIASELNISETLVNTVLDECDGPESINNSPQTAPSKRLDSWSKNGKFPKTTTGIAIARKIGIARMREKCPLFNTWIQCFEAIV